MLGCEVPGNWTEGKFNRLVLPRHRLLPVAIDTRFGRAGVYITSDNSAISIGARADGELGPASVAPARLGAVYSNPGWSAGPGPESCRSPAPPGVGARRLGASCTPERGGRLKKRNSPRMVSRRRSL